MKIDFEITNFRELQAEERGQANKILAYVNGDITVDSQKISRMNGIRLIYSKFYGKKIIDPPQVKGSDGTYREVYTLSTEVKKAITEAVVNAYEARKSTTPDS